MNTLLKILREINFDRDRAVVIGRSGLNLWEGREGSEGKPVFGTDDMDLLCPDIRSARECESILIGFGFTKMGAEFISTTGGSIDVLISDPDLPPGADYGFSNMPILRELWDARERIGGVLVVPAKAAILHKAANVREGSKDSDTIALYLRLHPEEIDDILADTQTMKEEQRETVLLSLWIASPKGSEIYKKIEGCVLRHLMTKNSIIDGEKYCPFGNM